MAEWVTVAGSPSIERIERLAVRADGGIAAFAEMPQGAAVAFNAGEANEVSASGRAAVISYRADGSLAWVVPLSAAENLFPERIRITACDLPAKPSAEPIAANLLPECFFAWSEPGAKLRSPRLEERP
jgi:hypothetical protein